ncbi:unnamed protein product [Amoebophrya sp. A25]|nr:unnamed protein product [Amoebophrya sp. A25]|eukprot:GSA25T00021715001.1
MEDSLDFTGPSSAEKAAVLEWLHSFQRGSVGDFAQLMDGQLLRHVASAITGHGSQRTSAGGFASGGFELVRNDIADSLVDAPRRELFLLSTKPLAAIIGRQAKVVRGATDLYHLYRMVTFLILLAVECPEKNQHIAGVIKLSGSTQRVVMQIIQSLHDEVEAFGKQRTGPTYSLEDERDSRKRRDDVLLAGASRDEAGGSRGSSWRPNSDVVENSAHGPASSSAGIASSESPASVAHLQDELERLRSELSTAKRRGERSERAREEALHDAAVEQETQRERERVRFAEREQELLAQLAQLRDHTDVLQAQADDYQALEKRYERARREAERWRAKYEELVRQAGGTGEGQQSKSGRSDALADGEEGGPDGAAVGKSSRGGVDPSSSAEETLRLKVRKLETEKAGLEERASILHEKHEKVLGSHQQLQQVKQRLEIEIEKLQQDLPVHDGDTLKMQLERYRDQVAALKNALETVRSQVIDSDASEQEARAALEAHAEALRQERAHCAALEKRLEDMATDNRSDTQQQGADTRPKKTSSQQEMELELRLLNQRMERERKASRDEQMLMSSTFHEIGLRYHQLLSEYKHVLRETGKRDRLFQKDLRS